MEGKTQFHPHNCLGLAANRIVVGLFVIVSFTLVNCPSWAAEPIGGSVFPVSLDYLHQGILRGDLQVMGAQSCAAASCHGGPRPGLVQETVARGNAYPIWFENDPHAQSWNTFCSPESVAMMRRLDIIDAAGEVSDQAGYDNCLACHNSTPRYDHGVSVGQTFRREGVGCSGCHGPSQKWAGTHYQDSWCEPAFSHDGYVPMNDYLARARVCASCHIGDQDRDMNHDIIAAGHPPLRYDFATYHHRQPKHWRSSPQDDEARLWLAGQVAATDASMALLVRRTESVHQEKWPALSSYDCSSCHHSLGFSNRRSPLTDLGSGQPKNAFAIASSWNDSGLRFVVQNRVQDGIADEADFRLISQLNELKKLMESSGRPDIASVHSLAIELRSRLSAWVSRVYPGLATQFTSSDLAAVVVDAASQRESYDTWESTVQLYLAAVASRSSWPNEQPIYVAERLRRGLRYPDRENTPEFSKEPGGPTLQREEAAKLSVELAAWLGNVQQPNLESWDEDSADGQSYRQQLQELLDRINTDLGKRQVKPEIDNIKEDAKVPGSKPSKNDEPPASEPPASEPKVRSPQELLEELRKRRSDALNNPFGND